ncbi:MULTISPECIES: hypothetical protein [unclassified Halomonas]|uniref:hypothetical protein n=1 Tax=unclassified Halomonas TaxID=2609666 RepID=UPI0009909304|nr:MULTISPECIES: hypothetical protein [unclassified Halomonas]AQU82377.1 hypothetical protein B2G49_07050 [Halomonas sp. 'Soap Lake \
MIPIGLPSVSFLLTIAALFSTTLVWLIWTLRLVFLRKRESNRYKLFVYLLVTVIAFFTLFKTADVYLQLAKEQRASNTNYRLALGAPQQLGHIDMPAGTQLQLALANLKDSFKAASFPEPVLISGIQALRVERDISSKINDSRIVGFTPTTLRVIGQGTSLQAGWYCDATQPIQFTLNADGEISTFSACTLALDTTVDEIVLPAGTVLRASTGKSYTDGFVDIDRWTVYVQSDAEINVDGLVLTDAHLTLDNMRRLHEIGGALLIRDTQLGELQHAAGSTVRLNPRRLRETYPAAWLIEIPDGSLSSTESNTIHQAHAIQDRTGNTLAILPAR